MKHLPTVENNSSGIQGLILFPTFFSEHEQLALTRWIDSADWNGPLRRKTQHYGFRYPYDRRPIAHTDYLGPVPRALGAIGHYLGGNLSEQAIVNAYEKNEGISRHIDHVVNFGPTIASISLISSCEILFERGGEKIPVRLSPGDLLLMTGESRSRWTHAIPLHSERRYSVTFRSLGDRELVHNVAGQSGIFRHPLHIEPREMHERETLSSVILHGVERTNEVQVGTGTPATSLEEAVRQAVRDGETFARARCGSARLFVPANDERFYGDVACVSHERIAVVVDGAGHFALYDVERARAGAFAPHTRVAVTRTSNGDVMVEPDVVVAPGREASRRSVSCAER